MKKLFKIVNVGKGQTILTLENLRRVDSDYTFSDLIEQNNIELLKDGESFSKLDLTNLLSASKGLKHQALNVSGKLASTTNKALLFGGLFQNTLITIDHLELANEHFTKIINEGAFTITFEADGPNGTNLINNGGLILGPGQYAEIDRKFDQNKVFLKIY